MFAVTDISEVYDSALAKAVRGIAIVDKSYVVVKDEIKTLDRASKIRWTMLTPAKVTIKEGNTAELTLNGKSLLLKVNAPGKIEMKTWSTDPPNSYDAPNPGTTLVGFEIMLPANTTNSLEVHLIPGTAGNKVIKPAPALASWK
jgi:hypothetical protein